MKEKTIIIVGGGQAAAMAAASLRQQGFTGELHLFSDERHLPYERPPLSKSMLLEDSPQLQQVLPANWWQENNVHLHSGVTIKTLGRDTRELVLTNGESWHWDQLFIATGAAARPLPLLDTLGERCFTLRHAGDEHGVQVGARGVNGGGVASGARAEDQNFRVLGDGHGTSLCCARPPGRKGAVGK